MAASNFREILRVLAKHGVGFVVVGGVSAVLQGAPVNTFDLDVVHSTKAANVAVLNLVSPIRVKEATASEKDYAMLPILNRTLAERGQK